MINEKEKSEECQWDKSSGYLTVQLMNKGHREVYLRNVKIHQVVNATDNPALSSAQLGGIIGGGTAVGVIALIIGIGITIWCCWKKNQKEDNVDLVRSSDQTKCEVHPEEAVVPKEVVVVKDVQKPAEIKPLLEPAQVKKVEKEPERLELFQTPFTDAKWPTRTEALEELSKDEDGNRPKDNLFLKYDYFRRIYPTLKTDREKLVYGFNFGKDELTCVCFQDMWMENFDNEWFIPFEVVNIDIYMYMFALGVYKQKDAENIMKLFNCYGRFNEIEENIFTSFDDFKVTVKKI
uniref:Uncharacterized protein n=1 Tax=Panagrolaimus sp. JU765 TaxID=591449 RepID=A0AC34RLU9_9BILA